MKGYKAFDKGLVCRGFQFEVGKTYKHNGEIGLCESGFHFCQKASDCAIYYNHAESEFAEVEAVGRVLVGDNKCVTSEIVIVRKIERHEFYALANEGKDNIGASNTGDRNTGDRNTGDSNTGYSNTGNRNTGYRNTGDSNTGYRNTGDSNTGNWNYTDRSTGFFCTEPQTVKLFDIDTGKIYEEIRDELPRILWSIPFGNYWENDKLKEYTGEDRKKFYDGLSEMDKSKIKGIPNFDAYKFEKCTGIKV